VPLMSSWLEAELTSAKSELNVPASAEIVPEALPLESRFVLVPSSL
jgi:hypothetical protein